MTFEYNIRFRIISSICAQRADKPKSEFYYKDEKENFLITMRLRNTLQNIYSKIIKFYLFEKLSQNVSIFLIFCLSATIYDNITDFLK